MLFYIYYLFLIRIIFAYDCEEICNVTISIMENTSIEKLQWNLNDLIFNRRIQSYEYFQYSLSNPSEYFHIESIILKYHLKEFDREKICQKNNFLIYDECSLELQIFTQTSFIILFKLIILDDNDWIPLFKQN